MDGESLLIVMVALLGLMLTTAFVRRLVSGWRKDALSVTLVVLALLTAFLLFFTAGTLVRKSASPTVSEALGQPGVSGA